MTGTLRQRAHHEGSRVESVGYTCRSAEEGCPLRETVTVARLPDGGASLCRVWRCRTRASPRLHAGGGKLAAVSTLLKMPTLHGIGDPTVMGWTITCAYLVAGGLSYRAAGRCADPGRGNRGPRRKAAPRIRRVWLGLAGILILLGINKQLDFQLWLTHAGRWLARTQGWYEQRLYAQLALFVLLAIAVIAAWALLARQGRGSLREIRLALVDPGLLGIFVLARGISFDLLDLRVDLAGVKAHEVIEAVAIALVGWSAATFKRSSCSSHIS